jgi:peptidoglycan/LPS O-acetylase OafA/YrhL
MALIRYPFPMVAVRGESARIAESRPTIGTSFNPRRNSLNFVRLVLATCVLTVHAARGQWNTDLFHTTGLGTSAVFGFFGISGFLIAGSADHNNTGRYLWARFLRIVPAFWVCLIVIAVFFSNAVPKMHFGVATPWVDRVQSPIGYITHNFWLKINQPEIEGYGWNAPFWTLMYEFLCYLILGALALAGLLRRKEVVAVLAGSVWLAQIIFTFTNPNHTFNLENNWIAMNLVKFASVFLIGTLIYLYRDKLPDSGWVALACAAVILWSMWLPTNLTSTDWGFTAPGLFMPLMAYPMIWLGIHLPFHKIGSKNDYSYGVYIYAFPITVLLSSWGARRWGTFPFLLMVIVCTMPAAACSWWLVEKHALKLKHFDFLSAWDRLTASKSKSNRPLPQGVSGLDASPPND